MLTVQRRAFAVLLTLAAAALIVFAPAPGLADPTPMAVLTLQPHQAELTGLADEGGSIRVSSDAIEHSDISDGTYGFALWRIDDLDPTVSQVVASSVHTELEVRTSLDGETWTSWGGPSVLAVGARSAEVRATVTEGETLAPVELKVIGGGDGEGLQSAAQASNPTVRLWATREGLVGGRTANGHRIVERDKFVALPSRKALAKLDGREYLVKLNYKGKEATAPVWDVGPWNSKDNYWDPTGDREMFKDLPRFVPQAWAAWSDGHNGGRDQNGRWVSFPASIDIADGTFWDDLGMKSSDWVDVTFLWLNAPSPSPLASYPSVGVKPAPAGAGGQPTTPTAPPEPPAGQRWYFAEGSTQEPFQTWLLLQNPQSEVANVTMTYMLVDGSTRTQTLKLPPTSRQSVYANEFIKNAEFSTRVDSDRPIVAERAMYFRKDGHDSPGVMRPEKRWCFAQGTTRDGADTWILVQNPNANPTKVVVSFYFEGGGTARQPMDLPGSSRKSLYTNLVRSDASFGICVDADDPVVAERATYTAGGGGNGSTGVNAPAPNWYFAEGSSSSNARTTLAVTNPSTEQATVDLTYLLEGGGSKKRSFQVPPMGKTQIDTASDAPGAAFGMALTSSKPVVAERATYFGPGMSGTHATVGAPTLAKTWYLAEGSTGQPFQEYVMIANPGSAVANVNVDFMRTDGSILPKTYQVQPQARISIDANAVIPNTAVSVRVRSDQPVVAERSMYWDNMNGGTGAIGVPWDR